MDWTASIKKGSFAGVRVLWELAKVIVPAMVVINVLEKTGWLAQMSAWLGPILRPLRLPDAAGLPMAAGLTVGLTYGAGVLIQVAEERSLTRNEMTVLCIFLGICHAVVEETILFIAAGSNGLHTLRCGGGFWRCGCAVHAAAHGDRPSYGPRGQGSLGLQHRIASVFPSQTRRHGRG